MPSEIQTPSTTPSIDRLTLAVGQVRSADPSSPGYCCAPCFLAEPEPAALTVCGYGCFADEVE